MVTLDEHRYIFYEVKCTISKIDKSVVNEEIRQLKELNLSYYNLCFVLKSRCNNVDDKYILLTLEDLFNAKKY